MGKKTTFKVGRDDKQGSVVETITRPSNTHDDKPKK